MRFIATGLFALALLTGCAPYKYQAAPISPLVLAHTLQARSLDDPDLQSWMKQAAEYQTAFVAPANLGSQRTDPSYVLLQSRPGCCACKGSGGRSRDQHSRDEAKSIGECWTRLRIWLPGAVHNGIQFFLAH